MERTDPRQGTALVRLFRGFHYLLDGWVFVVGKHPSLIKLCLIPLLINIVAFAGVAVAVYHYYDDLVLLIWARPESWPWQALWYALYVFILAAVLVLAYFAFFVVQGLLAAPFNDLLSERVELLAYGKQPLPFSLWRTMRGMGRSVVHELTKLLLYAAVIVPLFVLNLAVPAIGTALFVFGGIYMTALFLSYDYLDFAMARYEWSFSRKWQVLKQHRALTLGFGCSIALALAVPLVGLACVPMAAVGGTLLFCDLERAGAFDQQGSAE